MTQTAHLWAIGYDDMERAEQVRDEMASLGWGSGQAGRYLILLDLAVVVRHPDGSFTLNREPFSRMGNILGLTAAGFLAGLVVGAPLPGAAAGALLGTLGNVTARHLDIDENFIREVEAQMKPGTSALFMLDDAGDMEIILDKLRGLGGKVLKTNVDPDLARQIQSVLKASAGDKVAEGQ